VLEGIERADTMKLIDQLDQVRYLVQATADAALSARRTWWPPS
jgi:hypothetical protein